MSKFFNTIEHDDLRVEAYKYRIDGTYRIIKLIVSAILIGICGALTNHYIFTFMRESENFVWFAIIINAVVVLLLLGVSIENILTLIGKAKFIKTNGIGIPKDSEDS